MKISIEKQDDGSTLAIYEYKNVKITRSFTFEEERDEEIEERINGVGNSIKTKIDLGLITPESLAMMEQGIVKAIPTPREESQTKK